VRKENLKNREKIMTLEDRISMWMVSIEMSLHAYTKRNFENIYEGVDHVYLKRDGGRKFLRINKTAHGSTSVYAFIALVDGHSKALGMYKAGDVMMPAGYKAPAKHARGNVFNDDGGTGCVGPYGVEYRRGPNYAFNVAELDTSVFA
jgi:hypothetical protein